MALTALDPAAALIVVDLQEGLRNYPTAHPFDGVVRQSRLLADAFRARKLPVVLVNVTAVAPGRTERPRLDVSQFPAGWADLVPELGRQADDLLVTKISWGAFANTDLHERLKGLGVTQVVVTGVATSVGVEATARQAYEAGYNVALAVDAMTDSSLEAHDHSLANVFPRLGESGLSAAIIDLLP